MRFAGFSGLRVVICSYLFLPLIPPQKRLFYPRATWHSQSHANNQQEAKNVRHEVTLYSDVCLLSKDHEMSGCSLLILGMLQGREKRPQKGSEKPWVLLSDVPFSKIQVCFTQRVISVGRIRNHGLPVKFRWLDKSKDFVLAKKRNMAVYLPTDFLNLRIFSLSVNIEKRKPCRY